MAKTNNKGFSMVELIIAIAVFTMLAIPIIKQITTSVSMNSRARATQKTAEFAEYVMEYMKKTPLDQVGKDELFQSELPDGSSNPSGLRKDSDTTVPVTVGGKTITCHKIQYKIDSVKINNQLYSATVDLDTSPYADKSENPNIKDAGNLTNIDTSKVAIFAGQTSNNDISAAKSIFTVKTEQLKKDDYKAWEQLMYGGYNLFSQDSVKKITRIKLTKSVVGGDVRYRVGCTISYKDDNEQYPADVMQYTLAPQVFEQDEPPVIYLMYNPCIYNGEYMKDDNIILDIEGFSSTDNIKMYMIETADTISKVPERPEGMTDAEYEEYKNNYITIKKICDEVFEEGKSPYNTATDRLVPDVNTAGNRVDRNEIVTHFNLHVGVNNPGFSQNNVKVYTNKSLGLINDHEKIGENVAGLSNDAPGAGFVKGLEEDVSIEDRLYTMKVTLYNASGAEVVSYSGTKGAD